MSKEKSLATGIDKLYGHIKQIIEEGRNKAYRAANLAMVQSYWHIGKLIVEEEQSGKQRAEYGKELIKQLSERLTKDFGKGFTSTNLKYMRQYTAPLKKVTHCVTNYPGHITACC